MNKWSTAFLGLGSNIGNRAKALSDAVDQLDNSINVKILAVSPVYETSPVDLEGPYFYNAVVKVKTLLSPEELLKKLQNIERMMGRTHTEKTKNSRIIDIDLLLFADATMDTQELTLPHPEISKRLFVLLPLADIESDLIPQGWKITVTQAAEGVARMDTDQEANLLGELKVIHSNA